MSLEFPCSPQKSPAPAQKIPCCATPALAEIRGKPGVSADLARGGRKIPCSQGISRGVLPARRTVGNRLGEVGVFLAAGAAERLDHPELCLGVRDIALDDIGLAEILADFCVTRVERDRFLVIADP